MKFLVIDDDELVRTMICSVLRNRKCTVYEAVNGEEGVKLAKEHSPNFVITDMLMPDKEGIQTIIEIKALNPDIKIIANIIRTLVSPRITANAIRIAKNACAIPTENKIRRIGILSETVPANAELHPRPPVCLQTGQGRLPGPAACCGPLGFPDPGTRNRCAACRGFPPVWSCPLVVRPAGPRPETGPDGR